MEKYRLMLVYAFLFFVASLSIIIVGTNLTYEVSSGRQEERPASVPAGESWVVQKVTKGIPPVRIVTQTEWKQRSAAGFQTTKTRQIHWANISGVVGFSVLISGFFIFFGAAFLMLMSKIEFPSPKKLHLGSR